MLSFYNLLHKMSKNKEKTIKDQNNLGLLNKNLISTYLLAPE